jgi:hypothetical protein
MLSLALAYPDTKADLIVLVNDPFCKRGRRKPEGEKAEVQEVDKALRY